MSAATAPSRAKKRLTVVILSLLATGLAALVAVAALLEPEASRVVRLEWERVTVVVVDEVLGSGVVATREEAPADATVRCDSGRRRPPPRFGVESPCKRFRWERTRTLRSREVREGGKGSQPPAEPLWARVDLASDERVREERLSFRVVAEGLVGEQTFEIPYATWKWLKAGDHVPILPDVAEDV